MNKTTYLIIGFSLFLYQTISSQISRDSELFKELKEMDNLVFQKGFNECDLSKLEDIIHDEFEFYHDKSGYQEGKTNFIETFKENICSNSDFKPIRFPVEESIEVFSLNKNGVLYGAIQKGEHLFYIKEPDKKMYLTSSAKFTHIWILVEGNWKLSKVLSYDHKTPDQRE